MNEDMCENGHSPLFGSCWSTRRKTVFEGQLAIPMRPSSLRRVAVDVVIIHHHEEGPGVPFQAQAIQQVRAGAQVLSWLIQMAATFPPQANERLRGSRPAKAQSRSFWAIKQNTQAIKESERSILSG